VKFRVIPFFAKHALADEVCKDTRISSAIPNFQYAIECSLYSSATLSYTVLCRHC